MGEIVNLRRARKQKARVTASNEAAAKRVKFGRSHVARDADGAAIAQEMSRFEAHRREGRKTKSEDHE
jgi:hypothetical protein